ncbi:Protein TIC 20-II, chloroplastic, partial [Cucurbita argyrosperma subsp. sororia]
MNCIVGCVYPEKGIALSFSSFFSSAAAMASTFIPLLNLPTQTAIKATLIPHLSLLKSRHRSSLPLLSSKPAKSVAVRMSYNPTPATDRLISAVAYSLPFFNSLHFIAFFALYLGVVRNPNFNRYVRFNSMQAVTLDVLLAVPLLIQRILSPGPGELNCYKTTFVDVSKNNSRIRIRGNPTYE